MGMGVGGRWEWRRYSHLGRPRGMVMIGYDHGVVLEGAAYGDKRGEGASQGWRPVERLCVVVGVEVAVFHALVTQNSSSFRNG